MASDEQAGERAPKPAGEIRRARDLAKKAGRLARDIAATEDAVAETMDGLADTHSDDAAFYQVLAEHARDNAARERRHAADCDREAREGGA